MKVKRCGHIILILVFVDPGVRIVPKAALPVYDEPGIVEPMEQPIKRILQCRHPGKVEPNVEAYAGVLANVNHTSLPMIFDVVRYTLQR